MANTITIETDWGAEGANLTGAQVQAFIKGQLNTLFGRADENATEIEGGRQIVNVSELDEIGGSEESFNDIIKDKSRLFNVVNDNGYCVGRMIVFSDASAHCVTQLLFTHYSIKTGELPGDENHADTPSLLYRSYSPDGRHGLERGEWSEWRDLILEHVSGTFAKAYNDIAPVISVDAMSGLVTEDDYPKRVKERSSMYNVVDADGYNVGKLMMFSDTVHHTIVQYFISFFSVANPPERGEHTQKLSSIYRCWSIDGSHGPEKAWSQWKDVNDEHFQELISNNSVITRNYIEQVLGTSQTQFMSQAGVKRVVDAICAYIGLTLSQNASNGNISMSGIIPASKVNLDDVIVQETGNNTGKVMSQKAVQTETSRIETALTNVLDTLNAADTANLTTATNAVFALGTFLGLSLALGSDNALSINENSKIPIGKTDLVIAAETGNSATSVMSQAAVSNALSALGTTVANGLNGLSTADTNNLTTAINAVKALAEQLGLVPNFSGNVLSSVGDKISLAKLGFSILQKMGTNQNDVMSQAAVTAVIKALGQYIGLTVNDEGVVAGNVSVDRLPGNIPASKLAGDIPASKLAGDIPTSKLNLPTGLGNANNLATIGDVEAYVITLFAALGLAPVRYSDGTLDTAANSKIPAQMVALDTDKITEIAERRAYCHVKRLANYLGLEYTVDGESGVIDISGDIDPTLLPN